MLPKLHSIFLSALNLYISEAEVSWNVMAHAKKPDFVFRRNGRVHLNRWGASVQSTIGSRGVRISGSNAGYTMFRDSVKGTGYPLHSPVSTSLPLPCVTVYHHISAGVYIKSQRIEPENAPPPPPFSSSVSHTLSRSSRKRLPVRQYRIKHSLSPRVHYNCFRHKRSHRFVLRLYNGECVEFINE